MYQVFDLETETHQAYKRKASPYDERNWVVARGWKLQGDTACSWTYHPTHDRSTYLRIPANVTMLIGFNIKFDLQWEMAQGNPELLEFFKRGGKIWDGQYAEYLLEAQKQEAQMCSLNDTAPKYGGTTKIDEVKALWEAGVLTSDIPEDLLIDYLVGTEEEHRDGGDIRNTEIVFLGQIKRAHSMGMLKMIADRMDGLLCSTDMEFRGLKVDVQEAGRRLKVLNAQLAEADETLQSYVPDDCPFEFNWGSGHHASALIFGGTIKYQKQTTYIEPETGALARLKAQARWPIFGGVPVDPDHCLLDTETGYYFQEHPYRSGMCQTDISYETVTQDTYLSGKRKGEGKSKMVDVPGELKVKFQDFMYEFPGHTQPKEEWAGSRVDGLGAPIYSTSSDVIEEIGKRDIPFLKALTRKTFLDKEIGTYYTRFDVKKQAYVGMLTCVQPHDHMLHHRLNHTSTVTTRLSSSDPNLQNLPRNDLDADGLQKSEVKAMFVSRFGDEGIMIEADYSQLEVVVQGVLTGDENLCDYLRRGIDFHCMRMSAKFKNSASPITYEQALDWGKNDKHPDYKNGKKERTKCKIFSFQRAYGAGNATIALETGMTLEETKELSDAEDELFPGVPLFNAQVEAAVLKSAVPFQAANDNGEWQTFRRGYWQAFTGTLYSWRTYEAPAYAKKRGIKDSFNPPEMKNYPVQGTGGEFVQAILGLLWRHFISTDFYGGKAYLVNTVHDCVWIDCHKSVLDQVAADVKRIMESIPDFYNNRYDAGITVPFPVEVEVGANMNNMKHWIAA